MIKTRGLWASFPDPGQARPKNSGALLGREQGGVPITMWSESAPLSSTLPLCRSPWHKDWGRARAGKLAGQALAAVFSSNCCTAGLANNRPPAQPPGVVKVAAAGAPGNGLDALRKSGK